MSACNQISFPSESHDIKGEFSLCNIIESLNRQVYLLLKETSRNTSSLTKIEQKLDIVLVACESLLSTTTNTDAKLINGSDLTAIGKGK
jgi:small nuclear ribonucleoprotein (snRNP)-like protein